MMDNDFLFEGDSCQPISLDFVVRREAQLLSWARDILFYVEFIMDSCRSEGVGDGGASRQYHCSTTLKTHGLMDTLEAQTQ